MDAVNSEDIPRKLTQFSMSHFSTIFDQTQPRVFTGVNSTLDLTFPFSFQCAHMNHFENQSWRQGLYVLSIFSLLQGQLMHREHMRFNTSLIQTTLTWLHTIILSKKLRYHLQSERCSCRFFFVNILIRLSYTNRTQYCYAPGASFRNLFLKTTKHYAEHSYGKLFGLKRNMQNLVGRRRPFGTPLPTRPCGIRVTFSQ